MEHTMGNAALLKDQAYPQQKSPIMTQTSTHITSNNFPENKK